MPTATEPAIKTKTAMMPIILTELMRLPPLPPRPLLQLVQFLATSYDPSERGEPLLPGVVEEMLE
jgi:hypothetical protein